MGVMCCNVSGCDNIMCDRLINLGVFTDVNEFMNIPPPNTQQYEIDSFGYFDRMFKMNN